MSRDETHTETGDASLSEISAVLEGEYILDSRYELIARLGEGGSASVFKALHIGLNEFKAVKMLLHNENENSVAVARFQREARLTARLKHPNIVEVCDAGVSVEGHRFIVMDLLEGQTLDKWCKPYTLPKRDRKYIRDIINYVLEIAKGLAYAHENGIVHRDIKPGNLFLHKEGDEIVPKILDFGIAKRQDVREQRLTADGLIAGTTDYISPEQARGNTPDHRSDIYSLGVVLYEALTGEVPFGRKSKVRVMARATDPNYIIRSPSRLNCRVSKQLDRVVMRALARDPKHRYQCVNDMASALSSILEEETSNKQPNKQPRTSRSEDIPLDHTKAVRRRAALVTGIAAAAVVVLMAIHLLKNAKPRTVPSLVAPVASTISSIPKNASILTRPAPSRSFEDNKEEVTLKVAALPPMDAPLEHPPKEVVTRSSRRASRKEKVSRPEKIESMKAPDESTTNETNAETLVSAGNRALAEMDLDGAESRFNEAMRLNRRSAKAMFGLSRIAFERRRLATANVWIDSALEIRDSARWRIFKGDILSASGKQSSAISEWRKVIEKFDNQKTAVSTAERKIAEVSKK